MDKQLTIKGGEFLLKQTKANDVFIPEEFNEEQKMIAQTCDDFLETEVFPFLDRIDSQEEGLMSSIVKKAGELGLLGVSIPEEYQGFGQSFVTSMLRALLCLMRLRMIRPSGTTILRSSVLHWR